jgi:hypothetical protein
VGGAIGTLTGWLLPTLLYYRGGAGEPSADAARTGSRGPVVIPMPMMLRNGLGLSLTATL